MLYQGMSEIDKILDSLIGKVAYLQISCNVMSTEGRKFIATFGYKSPVDESFEVGYVEGSTMELVLRRVQNFIDSLH